MRFLPSIATFVFVEVASGWGGHVVLVIYYFRSLGYEAGLLVKSSADTPLASEAEV
jgi:hypothetical protein